MLTNSFPFAMADFAAAIYAIGSFDDFGIFKIKRMAVDAMCFLRSKRRRRQAPHIVDDGRNWLKMPWIDAFWIFAKMVNLIPFGNLPNKVHPCSTVSGRSLPVIAAIGVSILSNMPCPIPAFIAALDGIHQMNQEAFPFLSVNDHFHQEEVKAPFGKVNSSAHQTRIRFTV
jgi:hypothetical protein